MNSVAVEVEVDLPEGVRIRGYERHQGAHVFEVEFDLPSDCRCLKCGHEAEANIRYKNQTLVIRDLDLLGQPSFWVYQPPMHQCPRCRQRTQVPTPFKRPHVTYTSRFEQSVLEQLVGASVEEVARRLWLYRRRWKDLSAEEQEELEQLFDAIPELELPHRFREDVAEIFDTAKNRREAAARLEELRSVLADEPELLEFFSLFDRWREGILAYFDNHETSGPVEGLNTKARVVTRRSYGLKSADGLWKRLVLDVNRVVRTAQRTVRDLHGLARAIQAKFAGYYT